MLSIKTLQGNGYILEVGATAGDNLGLYYYSFHWVVCSEPSSNLVASVKGKVANWGRDKTTHDTNCRHTNLHGDLLLFDPTYTTKRSVVSSSEQESYYVGPPISVDEFTFTSGDKKVVKTGIVTAGLVPWVMEFPDHSIKRNYHYRNIVVRGMVSDNKAWIEISYQTRYGNSEWNDISFVHPPITIYDMATLRNSFGIKPVSVSFGVPSEEDFLLSSRDLARITSSLHSEHPYNVSDSQMFGDLCRRCATDTVALDRNNIEFFSELPYIVDGLKDVYSLIKKPLSAKTLASLYLNYKYGVRLTVQDFYDNITDLRNQLQTTSHAFKWTRAKEVITSPYTSIFCKDCTDTYNYKVYYNPYDRGFKSIVSEIWNYGMFPSLQNSWDLIPLSFVVDWFTDVAERLSTYDANTRFATLDIIGSTSSHKRVYRGVDPWVLYPWVTATMASNINITVYSRYFDAGAVIAPTYVSQPGGPFSNYAEATALFIALSGGKN